MAKTGNPFVIVPWRHDFMRALPALALQAGELANTLFIFPHARPAMYLENVIKLDPEIQKPCILPDMLSVHELFAHLSSAFSPSPPLEAGLLDRVGLLLEASRQEQNSAPLSAGRMGLQSLPLELAEGAGLFFPWGVRLAELFEDCFYHARLPEDFYYTESYVEPFAAALLANLAAIHRRYIEGLHAHNWSTPAYNALQVIDRLRVSGPDFLSDYDFLQNKQIIIAGFHSLSGTEEILFRHLWENFDATICLHADPAILTGKEHWTCSPLQGWLKNWRAGAELCAESVLRKEGAAREAKEPRIRYYAGYDVHSQIAVAADQLEALHAAAQKEAADSKADNLAETVIILPDTSLLTPMLHHLPETDFNVSMGYPLERSALFRLLDNLLALQENRHGQGYYWRDCVRLIRHPYIKMLLPAQTDIDRQEVQTNLSLRRLLHFLEKDWRNGQRFINIDNLCSYLAKGSSPLPPGNGYDLMGDSTPEAANGLLADILRICLKNWENLTTLRQVSRAIQELCDLLLEHSGGLWQHFRIDGECLFRLQNSVIPELRGSSLKDELLSQNMLFTVLRQLIAQERVPFEASPLKALQVMGLLESRLLRFDNVFILNATDNILPGSAPHDPLLPDALRRQLKLPDARRKQRLSAYYFFRLLAGAECVHLFWQEGIESNGLQEGKKLKSRFVEELLWQEEQKMQRLFDPQKAALKDQTKSGPDAANPFCAQPYGPEDGPLTVIACPVTPAGGIPRRINKGPAVQDRLLHLLSGRVSSSFLDSYLNCPLRFYYERLAALEQAEEVNEGDDPRAVGTLLHKVLKDFYTPRLGVPLDASALSSIEAQAELLDIFEQNLANDPMLMGLPPDSLAMLRVTAPEHLKGLLKNRPPSRALLLEKRFDAEISLPAWVGKNVIRLTGILDQVDSRPGNSPDNRSGQFGTAEGQFILDYKTGELPRFDQDIWFDEQFWEKIAHCLAGQPGQTPDPEEMEDLFSQLRDRVGSLQLPLYIYLARYGEPKECPEQSPGIPPDKLPGAQNKVPFHPLSIINAAWVKLREDGKETLLLPEDAIFVDEEGNSRDDILLRILEERIPFIISFILTHMLTTTAFCGKKAQNCRWCPCADLCIVAAENFFQQT